VKSCLRFPKNTATLPGLSNQAGWLITKIEQKNPWARLLEKS